LNYSGKEELVVIGGSAGSLPVLMQIINLFADDFVLPVVIVIHRQRNVLSEFTKILSNAFRNKKIREPDDKEPIEPSCIYIAPQNYHLLIEPNYTFSLDYSELIKFSRPSIDVTFENAALVYKDRLIAVLLSGANNDGTAGLKSVIQSGGKGIVQSPQTAEFAAMPVSAIASVPGVVVLSPNEIAGYLNNIESCKK
jgi:two-component system chemotaxis response regulator CheB